METRANWIHGLAAVVALSAAALLIIAFLVTDEGVGEDPRSPTGCANPDIASAVLRLPPEAAAAGHVWM